MPVWDRARPQDTRSGLQSPATRRENRQTIRSRERQPVSGRKNRQQNQAWYKGKQQHNGDSLALLQNHVSHGNRKGKLTIMKREENGQQNPPLKHQFISLSVSLSHSHTHHTSMLYVEKFQWHHNSSVFYFFRATFKTTHYRILLRMPYWVYLGVAGWRGTSNSHFIDNNGASLDTSGPQCCSGSYLFLLFCRSTIVQADIWLPIRCAGEDAQKHVFCFFLALGRRLQQAFGNQSVQEVPESQWQVSTQISPTRAKTS